MHVYVYICKSGCILAPLVYCVMCGMLTKAGMQQLGLMCSCLDLCVAAWTYVQLLGLMHSCLDLCVVAWPYVQQLSLMYGMQ